MDTHIRLKLEMATRVRDFNRAHPSEAPGHVAAAARLEAQLARAEALALQAVTGEDTVHQSVATKAELRAAIVANLRLLRGIAKAAEGEVPEVEERFKAPRGKINDRALITLAGVRLANATADRDLLIRYGMSETFLEEFAAVNSQFERAMNSKNSGRSAHVGAHADLEEVTAQIMQTVHQLDVLNRHRFRKNAELRAAWKSARDVAWPGAGTGGAEPAA
jgi:hypothetical protein